MLYDTFVFCNFLSSILQNNLSPNEYNKDFGSINDFLIYSKPSNICFKCLSLYNLNPKG